VEQPETQKPEHTIDRAQKENSDTAASAPPVPARASIADPILLENSRDFVAVLGARLGESARYLEQVSEKVGTISGRAIAKVARKLRKYAISF
jgi:hypothetical protein